MGDWARTPSGRLLDSAGSGDAVGVERSLAAGADLEARGRDGWTAAMRAAWEGRGACLGLLIAAGADVDAKDEHGETASMLAAAGGRDDCLGLLRASGADLGVESNKGETAAMIAGLNGHLGLAWLIDGWLFSKAQAAELGLAVGEPAAEPVRRAMRV